MLAMRRYRRAIVDHVSERTDARELHNAVRILIFRRVLGELLFPSRIPFSVRWLEAWSTLPFCVARVALIVLLTNEADVLGPFSILLDHCGFERECFLVWNFRGEITIFSLSSNTERWASYLENVSGIGNYLHYTWHTDSVVVLLR